MAKSSIIYIGAKEIQAVSYKKSPKGTTVTGYSVYPLPEGCMINGLIINEEAFQTAVAGFVADCRFGLNKAALLVDSSQILLKTLAIPDKMQKKQILYAVHSELAALDNKKEYIYDYGEIRSREQGMSRTVLCCGIEKDLAEKYDQAFLKAGVRLGGMDVVPDTIIHMVERIPELCDRTLILCVLDGQNVLTYLFSNGSYIMHSRNRLLTPRGDERITGELLGRISAMNQFSQSQKDFEKVHKVYFCGLDEAEAKGCQVVADTFQLEADVFNLADQVRLAAGVLEYPSPRLFNATAALLPGKRKSADFFAAEKETPVDSVEKQGHPWAFLIVLAVCAVLLTGTWGALVYGNYRIRQEAKKIEAYTNDPQNLEAYQNTLLRQTQAQAYVSAYLQVSAADRILSGTTQPDSQMLYSIESTAGNIDCFDYQFSQENETLSFTCLAGDYRDIPNFVRGLKASGFFGSLSYSGYAYDENNGGYRFGISGRLARPKGGEQ